MSRILCIYPHDSSTRFLDRIQNHLKRQLGDVFHCYKVKPHQLSHDDCLERLQRVAEEELVIFLGHGRSDCLYGANSYSNALVSPYFQREREYENDNFISKDNISVLDGKKVFCLSCKSADGLGKLAVRNGAKAFIGFGDIPTDNEILPELGMRLPLLIARYKGEISWIVRTSLSYSIKNNHNSFKLIDTMRLFTNVRINNIILAHRGLRQRRLLADYLYNFKNEMALFGDGNESLFS